MLRLGIAWAGFLALWLLLVFQVTGSELLVGAVASGVTVVSGYAIFRIVPACFQPHFRWLIQIWRLPAMIAMDLWLLFKHLLGQLARKPSKSSFALTPFALTENNCEAGAQRALAILLVSTTPNSVVIDIDLDKRQLFFHWLEPAPVPALVEKLQS